MHGSNKFAADEFLGYKILFFLKFPEQFFSSCEFNSEIAKFILITSIILGPKLRNIRNPKCLSKALRVSSKSQVLLASPEEEECISSSIQPEFFYCDVTE